MWQLIPFYYSENYVVYWLAEFFHSWPHISYDGFKKSSSTFDPESKSYIEVSIIDLDLCQHSEVKQATSWTWVGIFVSEFETKMEELRRVIFTSFNFTWSDFGSFTSMTHAVLYSAVLLREHNPNIFNDHSSQFNAIDCMQGLKCGSGTRAGQFQCTESAR